MGIHDGYGKKLLQNLLGHRWNTYGRERSIDLAGVRADLD